MFVLRNYRISFALFLVFGYLTPANGNTQFQGTTMGTSYHITIEDALSSEVLNELPEVLSQVLSRVIQTMSHWEPDSEISKINRDLRPSLPISPALSKVLREAFWIYQLSDGAYDVTVAPLVQLWGFGPQSHPESPQLEVVDQIQAQIGMSKMMIDSRGHLRRIQPGLTLDLSSIAKGYAVDQVVERLSSYGVKNLLVEIGGEVRTLGRKQDRSRWKVGIQMPLKSQKILFSGNLRREILNSLDALTIEIEDRSIATSGTYEHRRSKKRHHIIDPRTGWPSRNGVVSVTVITSSCMRADALATALLVMGEKEGLKLVSSLKDTEALFLIENHPSSETPLRAIPSSGFHPPHKTKPSHKTKWTRN